jgi:hypothetical protein
MVFCLFSFVCITLYKSTFLNQSEPNFAHISPLVWKRPYGMYGPKKFDPFLFFDLLRRERVQNSGHNIAAGARHFRHSFISVILAGVSVT